MKLPGRAYPVVGAATAAAVLLALSGPAQGAVSTGWRVVFTHHYGAATNNSVYAAVVATGKSDAWAFGVDNWVNPSSGSPVAEHWNGSGWQSSTLPPGLTSTIYAASAASPSDVWAVTRFGGDLLHWDGSTWSVAKALTGNGELTGVTAFGPADGASGNAVVWAYGPLG